MKSIEQIIDDQAKRWERTRSEEGREKITKPLITFSREPGSGGSIIAKKIADQLGLDYFHNEIIQKMAENASISERLLKTLDERGMSVEDVGAAVNYDLIINTGKLGVDASVESIKGALEK
jgi:cytidylate kinase